MVPTKMFLTKGCGVHKHRLSSFEAALRDAKIERYNLVYVSSILPPACTIIPKNKGLTLLSPGEIIHCVLARAETNEPNRLISAAIGVARVRDRATYGYLSEHHTFGWTAKRTSEYAEDLAATMLATTLGIEFDPESAWNERKQVYHAGDRTFGTRAVCQSAQGNKDGLWTTVISAAVLII